MIRRLVSPRAILLVASALLVGCGDRGDEAPVAVVRRGDFERILSVRGRLAAVETLNVVAETNGKLSFMLAEGTFVAAGDPLFGLETADKEERLKQVLLDLAVAESGVARAREDIRIETIKNRLALEEKTKQLEFNQLSAKIAGQDLEKKRRQIDKQILPKSELAAAELAVEQARLSVTNAEIDLERLNEEIVSRKQTLQLDLEAAGARAQKAQAEVDEASDFLAKATARAPKDGVVIHARSWRGTTLKVGDDVWQGTPVMELPDLSAMQVEVEINEVDVAQVAVAQAARLSVDAYPDLVLNGSVREIAGVATELKDREGEGTGLRIFEAKVALDAQDKRLRPGMTARVGIVLDQRGGVLLVPTGSVARDAKGAFVTLRSGARRDVVVATSSPEVAVVTEGLAEGDEVLVAPEPPGDAASSGGPPSPSGAVAAPPGPSGGPGARGGSGPRRREGRPPGPPAGRPAGG